MPLEDVKLNTSIQAGPDRVAERKDENDCLLSTFRCLYPDRQQLLILKFVDGMSNADIGKEMGRSEGAIKSLYYRTLLSLREMFDTEKNLVG